MGKMRKEEIKEVVKKEYAKIAQRGDCCCGPTNSCCSSAEISEDTIQEAMGKKMGYTDEELKKVPKGANLGLGCGNPVATASLKEGEIVLDLGSGAGFDCFLAANCVGDEGRVIGVDMTPEMIERARENAKKGNYKNVEFRLGEIENLPVADNSIGVVISNCVINLSPDKRRVFKEVFRVLKPGGKFMVSDIVLLKELPYFIKNSIEAYIGCLSGATMKDEYINTIKAAGFQKVSVVDEAPLSIECMTNDPTAKPIVEGLKIPFEKIKEVTSLVLSAKVCAVKPGKIV